MTCLRVTGTGDLLVGCGSGQLVSLQWAQEAKKQVQKHRRIHSGLSFNISTFADPRPSDLPYSGPGAHLALPGGGQKDGGDRPHLAIGFPAFPMKENVPYRF